MQPNETDNWKRISPADMRVLARSPLDAMASSALTPAQSHSAIASGDSSPKSTAKPGSCPECGDTGWWLWEVTREDARWGQLQRCACGQADAEIRAKRHATAAARLGDELAGLAGRTFASFDVNRPLAPLAWRGSTFSTEVQRTFLRRALTSALDYAQRNRGWLYLHGHYGAGKSHLAAAVAHAALEAGRTVLYRSAPGLLAAKDATRFGEPDLLLDLLAADLVVLDDIGSEHQSGRTEETLFRLLNDRLNKPLVLTSNLSPDELSPRLESRIRRAPSVVCWLPVWDYHKPIESEGPR